MPSSDHNSFINNSFFHSPSFLSFLLFSPSYLSFFLTFVPLISFFLSYFFSPHFFLSYFFFLGTIPTSLAKLEQIKYFLLASNQFEGVLGQELCEISGANIDISGTALTVLGRGVWGGVLWWSEEFCVMWSSLEKPVRIVL